STLPLTFERTNDATAASPLSDSWLRLGGDYNGCEGAQWVHWPGSPEPELFFAAHHDGLFFRWSESRGLRLWLEGTPETSTLRPASPGFYAVEQGTRRLVHLKVNGEISQILAESFEGQRFNRPNDLRVHPEDGSVWFTDPNFLFRQRPLETQELPGQFVFRYQPQEQGKGTLTAPIQNLSIPNGIAFSETGDQLFVGDSRARTIWKYAVQADGTLGPPQSVRVFPPKNSPDGLAIAPDGHLWCAMPNGVAILDANTGEEKGFLPFSERCTSIDFIQDGDSHWVAVTTRTAAHVARFPF
ncbi:MAG: SMP-30/gluconolactonase/LRE family protein, partial [Verrucomicrobiota bacterium]